MTIHNLRRELPKHRWEQIDERALPFSDVLPDRVDAIISLGLGLGYAEWDPHHVVDNVSYLLGGTLRRPVYSRLLPTITTPRSSTTSRKLPSASDAP
jgi:hypothetical protein